MIMQSYDNFDMERRLMVDEQIVPRGIRNEAVLQAMRVVPRENFVLPSRREEAYADYPLPIICNQTISQPYIVALMTELLELPEGEELNLLEVGTGSGYQAAVLAAMGHRVTTIERIEDVAEFARNNLNSVVWKDQVNVVVGDGCCGWPESGPFDGILVTAASPKIPEALVSQLKPGSNLVIPCGSCFLQQMFQITRNPDGSVSTRKSIGCRFVPLLGKDGFQEV